MLDGDDRTMDVGDPCGDLIDIGNRGGEGYEGDILRTVNDDLLPDCAPPLIPHVMTLVEDYVAEIRWGLQVKHITQDLRGHDQDGGLRVHLDITGQDPDVFGAELPTKISIFLVAECLDGGGIG
jgi:hypothetical protein